MLIAKRHELEKDSKHPTFINLFHRKDDGQILLCDIVHIDTLSDLGLDYNDITDINNGKEVTIKLVRIS